PVQPNVTLHRATGKLCEMPAAELFVEASLPIRRRGQAILRLQNSEESCSRLHPCPSSTRRHKQILRVRCLLRLLGCKLVGCTGRQWTLNAPLMKSIVTA